MRRYSVSELDATARPAVATWGRFVAAGVALLVLTTGCGPGYDIAEVSGVVTRKGKPVEGVFVTFQPAGGTLTETVGPASYGHTDAEGKFTLQLITDDTPGAVVGPHRIIMQHQMKDIPRRSELGLDEPSEGKSEEEIAQAAMEYDRLSMAAGTQGKPKRMIPEKYRTGIVSFTVPTEGTDEANFDLAK